MAEMMMAERKAKKKLKKQVDDAYEELGNNLAGLGDLGEVGRPDWMEQVDSSDDGGGGLTKERKNFDLGVRKQESDHEDQDENNEEQVENNEDAKYFRKSYNVDPNIQVSDDEDFDVQLKNAQMQAKQKQEKLMNDFSGFPNNPHSEFDEKAENHLAKQSNLDFIGMGEVTGGIVQHKPKKKKKKNKTLATHEDQYNLVNDAYNQDLGDQPHNDEQNNDNNYVPDFLKESEENSQHKSRKMKKSARNNYDAKLAIREEYKDEVNQNINNEHEDEEVNFAERLNRLQEGNEDFSPSFVPPVVATGPQENVREMPPIKSNPSHQAVRQQNEVVNDPEAIDQLQEMFPTLDRETVETYYQLCGCNVQKTFGFISSQMNMFQEEEGEEDENHQASAPNEGIASEDVQFNLLAGNRGGIAFDPNVISTEERKMIEQALRDSEQQEREAYKARQTQARQVAQSAANHAAQRGAAISEQERDMEMIARSEGLHLDQNARKQVKKIDKKDNKGCCVIF